MKQILVFTALMLLPWVGSFWLRWIGMNSTKSLAFLRPWLIAASLVAFGFAVLPDVFSAEPFRHPHTIAMSWSLSLVITSIWLRRE